MPLFKLKVKLLHLGRQLWFKAALFGVLAVITALISLWLKTYLPENLSHDIGASTVDSILNIMASSMLAVTTFSLTTMVSAYSSATSNVTPRATRLLMEDTTTHNVLSTFIGSFIFSLVGIISLNVGIYDDRSRAVLFIVTLIVILLILITLIHWIGHLTKLGRVSETTKLVEQQTIKSLTQRAQNPYLGGNPLDSLDDIPEDALSISSDEIGYIDFIDTEKLAEIADKENVDMYIVSLPGTFLTADCPLVRVSGDLSDGARSKITSCFVITDIRGYDQDPRYGLCVLAEIASKGLSQGINDLGTPIDVIGRGVRVLTRYADKMEIQEPEHERLWVSPLAVDDMFMDFFGPICRDAAGLIEVHIRIQKALASLYAIGNRDYRQCARKYSRYDYQIAEKSLLLDSEKDRLSQLVIR